MKKVKEQEDLNQEQIRLLTIQQGRSISITINTPGWDVIENVILLTKANAELKRKNKMELQSTREMCLYYSGVVDGAEEVRKNIYDMIAAAKDLDKPRQEQEED